MKRAAALFALLLARPAFAYELDDVLSKLETADRSVNAIKFDFTQDIHFTEMGSDTNVSGVATFAKPNRMRVEKKKPDQQVTISNGKKMWVYNPAFKQVWEGTWQSWVQAKILPQGLIPVGGYVADLRKNFNLSLSSGEDGGVRLNARPKGKDIGYSLEIQVSTLTWMPTQTTFTSDSAVVKTALSSVEINPAVKDGDFSFKAPSGVDVIPLN